jgi:hypothetical protein
MARPTPRFRRRRELDELRQRLAREQAAAAKTDAQSMTALANQLAAQAARRPTVRTMAVAVPAIALGVPTDITITWATPLPAAAGSAYDVDIAVAPALLGRATWTIKSKSPTALVLTMSPAGLAISAGQWLIATAVY